MVDDLQFSSDTAWRLRPQAPEQGTVVCPLEHITPKGAKEFTFGVGLNAFRMFVVRTDEGVVGYVNLCPHYSLPLNVRKDEFLTDDGCKIMCRRHLAIFAIEDGAGLDGACDGRSLDRVPLHILNGDIVIG